MDELDSVDDLNDTDSPLLMCLVEAPCGGIGMDEKVNFGMVVVCPSTGDVVWDEFKGWSYHSRSIIGLIATCQCR